MYKDTTMAKTHDTQAPHVPLTNDEKAIHWYSVEMGREIHYRLHNDDVFYNMILKDFCFNRPVAMMHLFQSGQVEQESLVTSVKASADLKEYLRGLLFAGKEAFRILNDDANHTDNPEYISFISKRNDEELVFNIAEFISANEDFFNSGGILRPEDKLSLNHGAM